VKGYVYSREDLAINWGICGEVCGCGGEEWV
jgi:hypothetical protein